MSSKFEEVYNKRWRQSSGTDDEDILSLGVPKNQVEFFYQNYNRIIADHIKSLSKDTSKMKLLEIGCGRATSSIFQALELGIEVVPTDYSEEALKVAERNLRKYGIKTKCLKLDLLDMPIEDDSFDVVISLGVMEHIENPDIAFKEMLRVLVPGGIMISMNVPEIPNIQKFVAPINKVALLIQKIFKIKDNKEWLDKKTQSKTNDVYRSCWTGANFSKCVRDVGFKNVVCEEVNPFPTFGPVPRFLDNFIAKTYIFILGLRKFFVKKKNPFFCSETVSRCHFIFARKATNE